MQIVQEAHAHSIPEGKHEEQAYARRLGYERKGKQSERELFWRDHRKHTQTVRSIFDRLFYGAQKEIRKRRRRRDLERPRQPKVNHPKIGRGRFRQSDKAYENLLAVRDGEVFSPPSPKRLKVLRTLGPALIAEIAKSKRLIRRYSI